MTARQWIILLTILFSLTGLYGCSSEPTTKDECIATYASDVKNDQAKQAINKACNALFDNNDAGDEYYTCILEEMPAAETDKDVNIILRKCRMKGY